MAHASYSGFAIDVTLSPELQTVITAMKTIDRPLATAIRQYTRSEMLTDWKADLADAARTDMDTRILVDTASVSMTDQNVQLKSGTTGRLSNGLLIADAAPAVEFGGNREKVTRYPARSKRGKIRMISRHTIREFPPRIRAGRVVFPTARKEIPRYASMWVQICMRTLGDIFDGRSS